ncbi:MAG: hypothetical protein M3M87_04990 [Thermoproteota archaeon]|nr:hypothetical protein [Thermoproteota archaeon]
MAFIERYGKILAATANTCEVPTVLGVPTSREAATTAYGSTDFLLSLSTHTTVVV